MKIIKTLVGYEYKDKTALTSLKGACKAKQLKRLRDEETR